MSVPDFAAVERAAAGRTLRRPRGPQRGKVGEGERLLDNTLNFAAETGGA